MAELTPEMKAQLEEQKKQCPFCKIIKGEIEAKKVYEDDTMLSVLDINPWIKGHMLIMPKEHYPIMPLIPPETFIHMFGKLPKLCKALKDGMISTGANVFIANGGVAGQQSPHFLFHMLAREEGDSFDIFSFEEEKNIEQDKQGEAIKMLAQNMPIMMNNHFSRTPAYWRDGNITRPEHLKDKVNIIYEDEKVLCIVPDKPQCVGHTIIYPKDEESNLENLDAESSSHLFYTASYLATAVFEGLGAQGTNIILKSGTGDDNKEGKLHVHVLPRSPDDGLDILPKPMSNKPNLDEIQSKIKDKTFMIEHEEKEAQEKKEIVNLDAEKSVKISDLIKAEREEKESKYDDSQKEINDAIMRIINS